MYLAKINFREIPEIGFALRHVSAEYKTSYGRSKKMSIEIAYINSGTVKIKLYGREMYAGEGSVLVLFRHLPISTETVGQTTHSHYTVLAEFEDYDFKLLDTTDDISKKEGFTIPFVTEPCAKVEQIARKLCRISFNMASDREKNALLSSVDFLSILSELSDIFYSRSPEDNNAYKRIASAVRTYVEDNIENTITLEKLSRYIGKSPNHIGHAFKAESGLTVTQYINSQKVKKIAALMQSEELPFKAACAEVSIADEAYGYRLFKRHMGVTPKQYLSIKQISRDKKLGDVK